MRVLTTAGQPPGHASSVGPPGLSVSMNTQFPSHDSGLFGPNPLKILAPPSNYLSKKGFWATQPLEKIL